jgi:Sugar (and other) transporter
MEAGRRNILLRNEQPPCDQRRRILQPSSSSSPPSSHQQFLRQHRGGGGEPQHAAAAQQQQEQHQKDGLLRHEGEEDGGDDGNNNNNCDENLPNRTDAAFVAGSAARRMEDAGDDDDGDDGDKGTTTATATTAGVDWKLTVAGVAGNVLEWYDFAVFGYFADEIGRVFFPPPLPGDDDDGDIAKSFAVFGAAFLVRPVGGVLLGYLGDTYGRKRALVASIFLMAVPTFCMGLLPTYDQVGDAAIVLLVLVRLLQGLSVGGQLMASLVYTLESHHPAQWGLYGSFVMAAANLYVVSHLFRQLYHTPAAAAAFPRFFESHESNTTSALFALRSSSKIYCCYSFVCIYLHSQWDVAGRDRGLSCSSFNDPRTAALLGVARPVPVRHRGEPVRFLPPIARGRSRRTPLPSPL